MKWKGSTIFKLSLLSSRWIQSLFTCTHSRQVPETARSVPCRRENASQRAVTTWQEESLFLSATDKKHFQWSAPYDKHKSSIQKIKPDWPLMRDTLNAPWLLTNRYSKWLVMVILNYLCLDPVFDHLHDCLHHLGVLRLVNESDKDRCDEHLAHVGRHRSDAVLHEVQTENQQLAGNVAEVGRRRRQVLACHALQHAHERRYQPVDVAQIVHARRFEDHQRAEQLRRRTCRHSTPHRRSISHSFSFSSCFHHFKFHCCISSLIIHNLLSLSLRAKNLSCNSHSAGYKCMWCCLYCCGY